MRTESGRSAPRALASTMPLPDSSVPRERLHLRRIACEGWRRADGLFDIEVRLVDTKDHDLALLTGLRPAGEAVHDMAARVTIDSAFDVHAVVTVTDRMPYPGACDAINAAYAKLAGTNLLRGFRRALHDAFGGVRGCSHLTELLACVPTVAVQTFAGLRRENEPGDTKPFQLDRCHALEHTTETVRRHYAQWHRARHDDDPGAHREDSRVPG